MKDANIEALFLGPQAENQKFFKEVLSFMVDDHVHWRRNFHPEDRPVVTMTEQQRDDFQSTLQNTQEALHQLAAKLKSTSIPFHSPRYLGHMLSDVLMPAVLGYVTSMLYNPNNVAWEASPSTTDLEIEVGRDLAEFLGFDRDKAWGHLCSGGHAANYEALWAARNAKSLPFAIREVHPRSVKGLSDWELCNLPLAETLSLLDKHRKSLDAIRGASVRGKGTVGFSLGKVLVPQSRHYSLDKALDVLGLGAQSLVPIPVDTSYRMDIDRLADALEGFADRHEPVLAVVGVLGSTEEGAVDELHRIVELRDAMKEKGLSFHLHVDAAWGGYARSAFRDRNGRFFDLPALKTRLADGKVVAHEWPSQNVYEAFRATSEADSITVDPHKLGYIPYQAGAVVFRDKRIRNAISYFAPYVFEKEGGADRPNLLGSFIFEGSKAGSTAAAIWAVHRCVPLNLRGYGKLIGESIDGAYRLYHALNAAKDLRIGRKGVRVETLTVPDLNIVAYAFNVKSNRDLAKMNALNRRIKELFTVTEGPVQASEFFVSSTDLPADHYGDAPLEFVKKLGIPDAEWRKVRSVFVLRSCVMTPYLARDDSEHGYVARFVETLRETLADLEFA